MLTRTYLVPVYIARLVLRHFDVSLVPGLYGWVANTRATPH